VLAYFPDARLLEIARYWKISQLVDPPLAGDWLKEKRDTPVMAGQKGVAMRANGRSADFGAP